jgi:prepilin-type N-terminal cleavage/methylation domain-containing protein
VSTTFRPSCSLRHSRARRGFNLIELLISLAITAVIMVGTMVAIRASFMAYQTTTEVASTNAIARLAMHRMLAMIRTGQDFLGPYPDDPNELLLESTYIDLVTPEPDSDQIRIEWIETADASHPVGNALYASINGGNPDAILEGVVATVDGAGNPIMPFTLEYIAGRQLSRVTIDLTIVPDDNMSVTLDGDNTATIRLVASTMPRITSYKTEF